MSDRKYTPIPDQRVIPVTLMLPVRIVDWAIHHPMPPDEMDINQSLMYLIEVGYATLRTQEDVEENGV